MNHSLWVKFNRTLNLVSCTYRVKALGTYNIKEHNILFNYNATPLALTEKEGEVLLST